MKHSIPNHHYDIAVVGGGMIGSIAAGLFTKNGFSVALIDQGSTINSQKKNDNPRVSALNLASQRVLDYLDCWQTIRDLDGYQSYDHIYVWEHDNSAKIEFDCIDYAKKQLGFIVKNNTIVNTLTQKLEQNFNTKVFKQTQLEQVNATTDTIKLQTRNNEKLSCKLLVGADGGNSKIRQLLNITGSFSNYNQQAIVCQVNIETSYQNTAWQCFLPTGPVALLPLKGDQCSIVWSSDNAFAKQILSWEDDFFCEQLNYYIGDKVGKVLSTSSRSAFQLSQYHADRYIGDRSVIIGDAAHTIHPLAGLSANASIIDVAALAEVIYESKMKNEDFSSHSTLRRYERWRHSENTMLMTTIVNIKRLFANNSPYVKNLRSIGLNLVDQTPTIKKLFANSAIGIAGDLPKICQNNQQT